MCIVPFTISQRAFEGGSMQGLSFRKKRRSQAKQAKRQNRKYDLSFGYKKGMSELKKESIGIDRWDAHDILKWGVQIGLVCVFAFMLVWSLGQRVSNAGDSMKPVLNNGDVVLIDRLVYNAIKPQRGDIIAFKPNGNNNAHFYLKRIVGLPGETVEIKEQSIYINGKKTTRHVHAKDIKNAGIAKNPVKLKGDEYFVIGDNHESSDDSRMADIGNVKRNTIYGKVWFVAGLDDNFGFVKR